MKLIKQGLLLASLVGAVFSMSVAEVLACTRDGSEGFVPENDLFISKDAKREGGITEEQFNAVIDKFENLYAPIIQEKGGELQVARNWDDGTVNAYAQQIGSVWKVSMFGGLARHETITEDGFALVVCHEIGHHIGGAPKKSSYWGSSWASNEGQADYFATLKCLRRGWENERNRRIVRSMDVPETLQKACSEEYGRGQDYFICVRAGMAGLSVAKLFQSLRRSSVEPKFDTPDPMVVSSTNHNHPATQCRLDTYFQGALCNIPFTDDVEQTSEVTGTCHATTGYSIGLRPLCWFKPSVTE